MKAIKLNEVFELHFAGGATACKVLSYCVGSRTIEIEFFNPEKATIKSSIKKHDYSFITCRGFMLEGITPLKTAYVKFKSGKCLVTSVSSSTTQDSLERYYYQIGDVAYVNLCTKYATFKGESYHSCVKGEDYLILNERLEPNSYHGAQLFYLVNTVCGLSYIHSKYFEVVKSGVLS